MTKETVNRSRNNIRRCRNGRDTIRIRFADQIWCNIGPFLLCYTRAFIRSTTFVLTGMNASQIRNHENYTSLNNFTIAFRCFFVKRFRFILYRHTDTDMNTLMGQFIEHFTQSYIRAFLRKFDSMSVVSFDTDVK